VQGMPQVEGVSGPRPGIKILLMMKAQADGGTGGSTLILDVIPDISLHGVRIPNVFGEDVARFGSPLEELVNRQQRFLVTPTREEWESIEKVRGHDVPLNISIQVRYVQYPQGTGSIQFRTHHLNSYSEISEAKWLIILEKSGYRSSWVVRVDRPTVEGWSGVMAKLADAQAKLELRDPGATITACRAAWMALDPLITSGWEEIAREIDRGSTKEDSQPSKSARVEAIRKDLVKFTHTGPHSETYSPSMADAFLAFRLTMSMISYLSEKQASSERQG